MGVRRWQFFNEDKKPAARGNGSIREGARKHQSCVRARNSTDHLEIIGEAPVWRSAFSA
jgi:hypothetical protein